MKKRNVVVSTLSEDVFEDVVNKLDEMEVNIVEKRYDLLYHRYEIYVRINFRQSRILRKFTRYRDAKIIEF